jgi:drug/metabolite transporter (DMT)-like permease
MFTPLIAAIVGEGILTFMDALIKGLTGRFPILEVTFLRFAMGTLWAALAFAAQKPAWPTRDAIRFNATRSALVVVTALSFFYALSKLPLAECMALSFLAPNFIALFGVVLLGERFDWRIGAALVTGLIGMAIIVSGQIGARPYAQDAWLGAAAIVLSAFVYALVMVLLRHRATKDPLPTIVLFQNAGPAIMLAVPAMLVWTPPSVADLGLFLGVGALGVAGHTCLVSAFARAEAARLAPAHYTVLAWGTLYGYLFFAEIPNVMTLLGATLIVAAVLVSRAR